MGCFQFEEKCLFLLIGYAIYVNHGGISREEIQRIFFNYGGHMKTNTKVPQFEGGSCHIPEFNPHSTMFE